MLVCLMPLDWIKMLSKNPNRGESPSLELIPFASSFLSFVDKYKSKRLGSLFPQNAYSIKRKMIRSSSSFDLIFISIGAQIKSKCVFYVIDFEHTSHSISSSSSRFFSLSNVLIFR